MGIPDQLNDTLTVDLLFNNGKILTVDNNYSTAQAVAVKDGRIIAVGSNNDVNALAGKNTRIIDLSGATLMPAINDSHCHISDWALTRPPLQLEIRYPIVKSIKDIISMVADKASTTKQGDWIIGEGWDEGYLEECLADPNRKPSVEDLDRVAPDNPVVLTEYSGHRSWVNSLALKMADITFDTPDPVGGKIGKTDTGELDGLLYEKASMGVRDLVPPPTYTQRKKSIVDAMKELNSLGITSLL
jgi:predicted amidohydrolase YtcJ